jgi:hypothetical protein
MTPKATPAKRAIKAAETPKRSNKKVSPQKTPANQGMFILEISCVRKDHDKSFSISFALWASWIRSAPCTLSARAKFFQVVSPCCLCCSPPAAYCYIEFHFGPNEVTDYAEELCCTL